MSRFCVAVLNALMRSTHFCNGDEGYLATASNGRDIAPDEPSDVSRGVSILAQARLHFIWRTDGANRHHANRAGREKEVDQPGASSSCAQFLHVASRPRRLVAGGC